MGGGPRTYRNCGVKLIEKLLTASQQCGSRQHIAQINATRATWTGTAYLAKRHAHFFGSFSSLSNSSLGSSGSGSGDGIRVNVDGDVIANGDGLYGDVVRVTVDPLLRRRGLRLLLRYLYQLGNR